MPRISRQKIDRIRKAYEENPSLKWVAEKENVDERTVAKYVDDQPIQQSGEGSGHNPTDETSLAVQTYSLLEEKWEIAKIAIKLDLRAPQAIQFMEEYISMKGYDDLKKAFDKYKRNGLKSFSKLFNTMENNDMNPDEFAEALEHAGELSEVKIRLSEMKRELFAIEPKLKNAQEILDVTNKEIWERRTLREELHQKERKRDILTEEILRLKNRRELLLKEIRLLEQRDVLDKFERLVKGNARALISRDDLIPLRMLVFIIAKKWKDPDKRAHFEALNDENFDSGVTNNAFESGRFDDIISEIQNEWAETYKQEIIKSLDEAFSHVGKSADQLRDLIT